MENTTVTMIRLYLAEESHSVRKAQMQKVLHLLRDHFRVRGITILRGVPEPDNNHKPHYETVVDVLRSPDPPAVIEFFCESAFAHIDRALRELVPDAYFVHWNVEVERVGTAG